MLKKIAMKKYRLVISRAVRDIGYVTIEAENEEDAKRKYFYPDVSKGEDIIFDSDIDWEYMLETDYYNIIGITESED